MLLEQKPTWIGFPCFTCNYQTVMELAAFVKARSDCRVVVGNAHASICPEDFIYMGSPIDCVVIGEGELTVAELLSKSDGKSVAIGLPGTAVLDADGKMLIGPKRYLLNDLATLPPLDFSLVDMRSFLKSDLRLIPCVPLRAGVVFSSRGCYSMCEFCAANAIWKCNEGPVVRFRPIASVLNECLELKARYGIQGVMIEDDSLLTNRKHAIEMCEALGKTGLVWGAQGRVNQFDEEIAVAFKKNGCILLSFGVETGSSVILKRINKGQTLEQVERAFAICRKYGLNAHANFMCNHPGETEEDVDLTKKLISRIKPRAVNLSVATPYPGSKFYEKYVVAVRGKLPVAQYNLFITSGPDVIKYFKLCEHNLPPAEIIDAYKRLVTLYNLPLSVSLLFNAKYCTNVLSGKYSGPVLYATLCDLVIYMRYFLVEHMPVALKGCLKSLRNRMYARLSGRLGHVGQRLIDRFLGTPN